MESKIMIVCLSVKDNKWQDKTKSVAQTENLFNDNGTKDNSSPPMSVI
ncbi:6048_t:CDS:2 [Acaulospora colombiana]|uniref:6048_t:CDS:1 n=1 Tax=Acaulospora colombiana TaxID=27376 RepID=A0ACA9KQS9_9GLOM|nr:6048_t:CDS:2 [Acaulospora colombiana]